MKKIVYGSLSVLTAVCTVFVAAKAEVFSENRAGGATSEVVESSDVNGLLEADSLGSLGTPLAGDQALSLDADIANADAKALGSTSLAENALSGQRAAKTSAAKTRSKVALPQGKTTSALPASGSSTSSAFSAFSSSPVAASVTPSQTVSAPVAGLQQSQPAASRIADQTIVSPVAGSQPLASQVISAESSEAVSPSVTPIAQSTPATVPTVPAGNSTLPGPGISPSSTTGLEAESDAMESDVEMDAGAEAEITAPESENSVEISQPAPAGDDPFGTTSSPATGDTLDSTTEPEGLGTDLEEDPEEMDAEASETDADALEMEPAVEPPIESDVESLDTGAEDLGTPGASDVNGADALDAETEDADALDTPTGETSDPFGVPSAPTGTEAPSTEPSVEVAPDPTDEAIDADGEGADSGLGQPTLEAAPDAGIGEEADMEPNAEFGEDADMEPDAEFGEDADTELEPGMSPEAEFEAEPGLEGETGLEEDADLEEDANLEEDAAPDAPFESPAIETPGTLSPATPGGTSSPGVPGAPSTTPGDPLPSTPSQSTPLPEGPAEGSSDPLSPIESEPISPFEEDAAPSEIPTSGSESFGSSDRLIGEGFSPFQLSYLAIGGGLEGIPGGTKLIAAYESGDVSAADIVDAGASTNRLGTDADNQDDYTAGVDRFLELLSREND